MRTGGTLFPSTTLSKMTTTAATAAVSTFSPPTTVDRLPWHSPVAYLFGGLASMLGLVAFALLILACSYWKLSGRANGGDDGGAAVKGEGGEDAKASPAFEEKFLVIMAGDVNPTFLATPISSKAASFYDHDHDKSNGQDNEKPKDQTVVVILENGEFSQD